MTQITSKLITRGIPAIAGLGLAWIAMRIINNESKLLLRQIELQDALSANSWKRKRSLLRRD